MVGRFYTVSYRKGNTNEANEYISSALFTCITIAAILLPIVSLATAFLDKLILIEPALVTDVKIAFFISCISFFLTTVLAVFMTGAYCENRLEISNGINILANIIRIVILVVLFNSIFPRIWFLSCSAVVQNVIAVVFAYISFKYLIPNVKFSLKYFRLGKAKELLSAGMFNSIILMGTTLMSKISLLVANRLLPAVTVGIFSSIILIPTLIQQIASAISSAFSPTTLAIYSGGNMRELKDYSNKVVAICAYLLGWPISIASALAIPVFYLWIGKDYSSYKDLFAVLMLYLVSNLSISQLNVVIQAVNKLKAPAYFSIFSGILNCTVAILLVTKFHMGLWGIVLANVFAFALRNIIFTPIYVSIITQQPWHVYFKGMFKPQLISILVFYIGSVIESKYIINNYWKLGFACIVLSIIYWFVVAVTLNKGERDWVLALFKKRLSLKKG